MSDPVAVDVGVVGVGSMGEKHARVLSELRGANLVGVADADFERAREVATRHATQALRTGDLVEAVDALIVAVPTRKHFDVAVRGLDADTHLLVEKPFVPDRAEGRELARRASEQQLVLQVGHVERFNPAIEALFDLVDREEIVAVRADRLGPPIGRDVDQDVVLDLMIHDIDVLLALMGEAPGSVSSMSCRDGQHASVLCEYRDDVVATLTASRLTQRKVRNLQVTTPDRLIEVDYLDQSVHIHRRSRPEYLQTGEDVRYRHESVIERPLIESAEPLKRELESFLSAVRTGTPPVVDANDALRALEIVWTIQGQLAGARVEARL